MLNNIKTLKRYKATLNMILNKRSFDDYKNLNFYDRFFQSNRTLLNEHVKIDKFQVF